MTGHPPKPTLLIASKMWNDDGDGISDPFFLFRGPTLKPDSNMSVSLVYIAHPFVSRTASANRPYQLKYLVTVVLL